MEQRKQDNRVAQHQDSETNSETIPHKKNLLEWMVFSLGLILVLGVIGYLSYQTATYRSGTPDLVVRYEKDPSPLNPNRYKIIIQNKGGETAEEVKIEATLQKADSSSETAELGVAFSPKLSEREGWVNFKAKPSEDDSISVRVVSFQSP